MAQKTNPFDRLAEEELRRHKPDLKYADLQLCKRRDYEVVARHISKRKRIALWTYGIVAVGYHFLPNATGTIGAVLWTVFAFRACEEYVHARRTEQILRRLREERDHLNGDARAGAAHHAAPPAERPDDPAPEGR